MIKNKKLIIKNMIQVIAGTLILSLGTSLFLIPFELVTGGVTGLAIVFDRVISVEFLSIDVLIAIMSVTLFIMGLIFLGSDFALKTLVSSVFYPIFVSILLRLLEIESVGRYFDFGASAYSEIGVILAAVFGGALVGFGCALTFLGGGSTGGVDIVAFIICKAFPRVKHSTAIFFTDFAVLLLGALVLSDIALSLVGVCSVFVCALVVDRVMVDREGIYVAHIVTDAKDKINDGIRAALSLSPTLIDAEDDFVSKDKALLLVSFRTREYRHLMNIIYRNDPSATVIIYRAHEAHSAES